MFSHSIIHLHFATSISLRFDLFSPSRQRKLEVHWKLCRIQQSFKIERNKKLELNSNSLQLSYFLPLQIACWSKSNWFQKSASISTSTRKRLQWARTRARDEHFSFFSSASIFFSLLRFLHFFFFVFLHFVSFSSPCSSRPNEERNSGDRLSIRCSKRVNDSLLRLRRDHIHMLSSHNCRRKQNISFSIDYNFSFVFSSFSFSVHFARAQAHTFARAIARCLWLFICVHSFIC